MVSLKNDLLVAFEKVATLGTVHAAAEDLHLTQAAVTKRIRLLEANLGISLFLRSRRGMFLTEEGKAVLQFNKQISEAEGHLLASLKGSERPEIALTVIGPTTFVSTRLQQSCKDLYARFPFLLLHLRSDDHSNLVETVRRGEADLAIVNPSLVPKEMESKVLKPDRFFLVASPKWKSRVLTDILNTERIIDFYESDQTTLNYLKKFNLDKNIGRSRLFVNENEALIHYFIAGIGFGTLAESIAQKYFDSGELIRLNGGKVFEDTLALIWYARSRKMQYFDELVRSIK